MFCPPELVNLPARQAVLAAKIPPSVGAITVNKVCGSGLVSVMLADQAIRAGDSRLVVAGGMENMSQLRILMMGCWRRMEIRQPNRSRFDAARWAVVCV